uniref:Uncharacterized protein n=1 Tax=Amphora coffeiformis TaxID=265554 RepID=A0A7S3P3D9_9STRA
MLLYVALTHNNSSACISFYLFRCVLLVCFPSASRNHTMSTVAMASTAQLLREGFVSLQNIKCGVALRSFQQCMMLSSQSVPAQAVSSHIPQDANTVNKSPIQAYPLELPRLNENISPHNVFLVFDRVFLPRQDGLLLQEIIPTICIYNIALTHHIRAMTCAHNSTLCFKRAQHFYRLVLQAAQVCMDMEDPDDPVVPIVLATLNNVGHIHCHFAQTNEMKTILESTCRLLPFIAGRQDMSQQDHIFFYSCKWLASQYTLQGAAAA